MGNGRFVATRTAPERFFAKVVKSGGDECWRWSASVDAAGYGLFRGPSGRLVRAHRFSWEMTIGTIPVGLFVCHRCDNPPCVNPAHLFLGTAAENNADRDAKGRRRCPVGTETRSAVLAESDVREIRKLRAAGVAPSKLAARFKVSRQSIFRACVRASWKHVE